MENQIELRSEKVRNIIGKVPNLLIRIGTGMFFLLLLGIVLGSMYFPMQNNYITTTDLQYDSIEYCVARVPMDFIKEIDKNSVVTINFYNNSDLCPANLSATISAISDTVFFENASTYKEVTIHLNDKFGSICQTPVTIRDKAKVNVNFYGQKKSLFQYLISYIIAP
ncbi:MAG: hypothetical protein RBR68_11445 [Tenuifilaceae bacterium]|jgi:hypothetical protein|nr:hypothetical protein [Tenuifilaceae bacterium]